ncbi:ATP synthase F1 subunit epsilon [Candidatus Pelagibacter sp. HIMB109]|uniref:ATP synthase F1 subunit epsilon n=1 Tax=Candidatus Pelagibacter sp. HIMB109 TaxID=3415412 RepID=UPI003F8772EC
MQVDIVTPEKVLFSEKDISMVTIPGIEGQMGILDDHLPVVTFLKPGVINVEKSENKYFFTTGGVVDFKNNSLSILCQEVFDVKDFSDEQINNLKERASKKLEDINSTDHDVFISNALIDELNLLKTK